MRSGGGGQSSIFFFFFHTSIFINVFNSNNNRKCLFNIKGAFDFGKSFIIKKICIKQIVNSFVILKTRKKITILTRTVKMKA